jgi:heptose III glucuronosyltransferase
MHLTKQTHSIKNTYSISAQHLKRNCLAAPAVTVVIPAFNAAPYIPTLLDELDEQIFRDFETIFVNDGSTDETGALLDAYATSREWVKVLHQPNGGVGKARNTGVNAAAGEFILFIDADDAISPSHLADLFSLATSLNLEVALCNGLRFHQTPGDMNQPIVSLPKPEGVMSGIEWCEKTFNAGEWHVSAWMTMVRRDFLKRHSIHFMEGVYYEDVLWATTVQSKAARIAYTPKFSYYYRLTPGSILGDNSLPKKLKHIESYINVIKEMWQMAENNKQQISELMKKQASFQGRILLARLAELGSFRRRIAISRELRRVGFLARFFREAEIGLPRKRIVRAYWFAWLGEIARLLRIKKTELFNIKLS